VRDDIYYKSYWFPYCDNMPAGVDYVFFDINVNMGLHEAALILQRALGVAADGHIGAVTSAALSEAEPNKLIDAMAAESVKVYKAIERAHPVDVKFDRGWMIRVAERTKRAHSLMT
jgi:lysozyme family protein